MKSFITGSRAYGKPTVSSDIDLVVLVDSETKEKLIRLSSTGKQPCKFGKLNLILCETEDEVAIWRLGTTKNYKLRNSQERPITSEEAKLNFDDFRKLAGVFDNMNDSGGV